MDIKRPIERAKYGASQILHLCLACSHLLHCWVPVLLASVLWQYINHVSKEPDQPPPPPPTSHSVSQPVSFVSSWPPDRNQPVKSSSLGCLATNYTLQLCLPGDWHTTEEYSEFHNKAKARKRVQPPALNAEPASANTLYLEYNTLQ